MLLNMHNSYQQQLYVFKIINHYVIMSEPPLPPSEEVKIRLKHRDWEVEITCIEGKVKQVVENVLSSIDTSGTVDSMPYTQISELRKDIELIKSQINSTSSNQMQAINTTHMHNKVTQKGGTTCRGLLEKLWYEGYFQLEKPLGEVHEELSRRGYNYDRTAVSHSLTDMVRESILTRTGTMRNYRYIQKKSAPSELLL
jgi:hypothetical protein